MSGGSFTKGDIQGQEDASLSRASTGDRSEGSVFLDVSDPAFESFREEVGGAVLQGEFLRRAPSMQNGPHASQRLAVPPPPAPTSSWTQSEPGKERVVYIDNPGRTNENFEFSGNKVRTSKYTLISFLPRNLFEQFHRVAYIYFLIIVILNQIPQLAVFGRLASLFPLLFVLVVTAIKDGYEDWGRHRSDRIENNRTSLVFQHGSFSSKKWKKIEAGEVVKIFENESIPCDIVLLGTSDANGVAYVQTINLDGENNLKTRYARQETASKLNLAPITGKVVCELPNRNIYDFVAYMEVDGAQVALGPNNIILRGCVLKNTSWVIGVVVYAGKETKAMLNSSGAQSKRSRLEQHMNKETLWLSLFLLVICIAGGIGMGKWVHDHERELNNFPYYKKRDTNGQKFMYYGPAGEGVFAFLSFIIMFQIMIPISLYISMELVRLGQSYFMVRDVNMFHAPSNSRLQCRALNINEDLGQIQYIFSDKTGTLTDNKMEFHSASIGGVDYSNVLSVKLSGSSDSSDDFQTTGNQEARLKPGVRLDPNLLDLLRSEKSSTEASFAQDYMLVLSACNTVIPTRQSGSLEYQAESPDEQALVLAAACYGYTLSERSSSTIILDVFGEPQCYKIIGIHEFDSVRKRMSIVVECPDQKLKLLVKGADSAVMGIIGKPTVQIDSTGVSTLPETKLQKAVFSSTQRHLDYYSGQGLRTLVVAHKELDRNEFEQWHQQYKIASTALVDRVKLLREAAGLIEKDLVLLGATAIEDKLQEGVPETIASLRSSGIKIWVLTGDKQETAISIGFSCSLLTQDMQQIKINANTKELCVEKLRAAAQTYGLGEYETASNAKPEPLKSSKAVRKDQVALIIDGNSLVHALSPEVENDLYVVAVACRIVICCRVAPLQKAGIVSLMKRKTRAMTLAIGDGANDVSMIQTADVGIGLSGQEGRQAVMASDFAMGQFRFLKRLLLVHGHWNYQRLAYMVLYNFYRNAVFVMMLFWYILHTAFSAQTALFDWNLMFYSLIYTSLPTIVVGIMDKDVSHNTLFKFPPLYGVGQRGESYNSVFFWATMLDTLWQSLVLFYVPFFTFQGTAIDIWGMGCLWTAAVVVLVNLHLAMDVQHWTWITHLAIWGSIIVSFACFLVLDSLVDEGFIAHYRVVFHMASTSTFWLNILLIVVVALLPRLCAKVVMQTFWPSDVHIARELELRNNASVTEFVKDSTASVELNNVPYSDTDGEN